MSTSTKEKETKDTTPVCKECGRVNPYMPDSKKSLCKSCLRVSNTKK